VRDTGGQQVTLAVLATKLDYVIQGVQEIKNCVERQDKRIEALERIVDILKWVGGATAAILVALGIAWLRQVLGL
jgi:hypothetical protein